MCGFQEVWGVVLPMLLCRLHFLQKQLLGGGLRPLVLTSGTVHNYHV